MISTLPLSVMVNISVFGTEFRGSNPLVAASAPLVQLEEHGSSKPRVKGSNPLWSTNDTDDLLMFCLLID